MQFWDAAGAAVALNRTLILPTFTCYCDELWYWSLEVKPSYGCRWPGAKNQTLPFVCPHDQLVNYLQLEDSPAKYGSPVQYRESSFLDNPRTPAAIKVGLELPQPICSPTFTPLATPPPPTPKLSALLTFYILNYMLACQDQVLARRSQLLCVMSRLVWPEQVYSIQSCLYCFRSTVRADLS